MNIEVTTSPNKHDLETISKGIQSFNQKYISVDVVFEPDTKFAAFAKDEKRGYKVYGELPDYPKGCITYCLVKELQ